MSRLQLTKNQKKVLNFLKTFYEKKGYAPSLKEIAGRFGFTIPTAQGYLRALSLKGAIGRKPNMPRSIIFKQAIPKNMTVSIPELGTISAGEGISLFEDDSRDLVEVPASMITTRERHYALKVTGFSMKDDGVLDGDLIVVRQQATAQEGDSVVAVLKGDFEEKATLKKIFFNNGKIELRHRNALMPSPFPLLTADEVEIRGKFCGLIRKD